MKHTLKSRTPRNIILFSLMVSMAVLFTASTSPSSGAARSGNITIGIITKDNYTYWVAMQNAVKAAAKPQGINVISAVGKYDTDNASQVSAIEDMITRHVKGILLAAADTKGILPEVRKAQAAGILVIAMDAPFQGANGTFHTNNLNGGILIGKWAKSKFAGKKAVIALLGIAKASHNGTQRQTGFLKGFGIKLNDPQVVGEVDTEADVATGQKAMETLLQKNPAINLVYAVNEASGIGAYQALKQAGKEKGVTIVTMDGGCPAMKYVANGVFGADSQQYPSRMATDAMAAVVKYVHTGVKPSGSTDTGVTLLTQDPQPGLPSKNAAYGEKNCW